MSAFFGYVILGISLAAPIGPVNAAQITKGIYGGFGHAWLVGLGAMLADAIYMAIVYLGVFHFLETPFMQTLLWSFGCFVLIYTGVDSIINAKKEIKMNKMKNDSLKKSFFYGFLLSITNPLSMMFWLGIFGSVLAKTVTTYDLDHVILYSLAIFVGLFIWDVTMAFISSSFRKVLTAKLLGLISAISGLSLIGFGLYFGVQAIKLLFF
ncbi:LysE family transporter [Ureibacillus chungkukjangi]|uniref:Threonine/homoserine/homoserine lactone efflux protein n=1 Tax=Ureibacillus chungkukjangi TaxID=1202712 RepID=A0A318TJW5_9BACL|nr:LysE family transporter [Ureibacillus chungkukjangi]MCM3387070.1 LysE family translocator [Ureibacillus chungkukjangi]PYF05191.1 threonine/homoserine/homoserine lactone efflux protein [Ureibacillus chungkukjangi]